VIINDRTVKALIDTGSMISSVSEQFYQTMPDKPEMKQLSDFELNITAANGDNVPYCGYIEVEVAIPRLNDVSLWVLMLVVRDTEYNLDVPSIICIGCWVKMLRR